MDESEKGDVVTSSLAANAAIPAGLWRKPALDSSALNDANGGHAAGILFVAPDGDVLLLRRASTEENYAGHWALPGGKMDDGESPEDGADRETVEEIGFKPVGDKKLLDLRVTPNKMVFHTFAQPSATKFKPELNSEHSGYAWAPLNQLPKPLHPAVEQTIADRLGDAGAMSAEDFAATRDGLVAWSQKEEEAEDSEFEESQHPRAPDGKFGSGGSSGKSSDKPLVSTESSSQERNEASAKAADEIKAAVEKFGGAPAFEQKSSLSSSRYIKFDGIDVAMPKSKRRAFFQQFPGANGAGIGGKFSVRISDHAEVSSREASMFTLRTDKPLQQQLDHLGKMLEFLSGKKKEVATDSALIIAFDRASVRDIDREGRLHIETANICKACVSPYRGSEIPNWETLGLEPDRIYQLFRDPEELKKATPTANGIQILRKHIPVDAKDHQPWDVVGAVGTTATWQDPYVQNGLTIWPAADIAGVDSGQKRELSPGYRYVADMTPGTFKGDVYDGVMRDISFNHIAIVEDGRQGTDIVIGDSTDEMKWAIIERALMSMGA